ncbi:AAA family ATPase [Spirulina sp. 06S082]|uniref:AAA family ATPase n=1 Tax=Spirulina sp. 06S082 TaxID=3110248 RepID=UPI002B21BB2C|nr:AAA family ATPase [Spirulina sp. 06S082]MEA5471995.1 AAA family ATPase [Spirulina sp. 06S082]
MPNTNKLERISIKGFRRFQDIDLEMRDLVVAIGANGSGKTSFLDVFSLLSASANGQLLDTLQIQGGLNEILTRGRSRELEIGVSMNVPDYEPLQYNLVLSPKGFAYEIKQETLTQHSDPSQNEPFKYIDSYRSRIQYFSQEDRKLVTPNWEHNYLETSLAQVPKMYHQPENLRKSLGSSSYYGALDVSPQSPIRLPQAMRPSKLPGANGENLASCLYNLRETNQDDFETIESILSTAFSDFEKLNFPPVAAGTLSITWKDKNFSEPIYMHELSEGMLRFLWLTTLLQSDSLSQITLIDEPEVSLHPELLQHLVYSLREAAKYTQLIVATHSDRLVRFLEPHEILICDLEEGATTMTWADTLDLEKWLEDYTLDQLWAMNILGGRP